MDGVKHEYTLRGSIIVSEKWTQNNIEHLLVYVYDETGAPIGLQYLEAEVGTLRASTGLSTSLLDGIGASASVESVYADAYIKIPIGEHQLKIGGSVNAGSAGISGRFGAKTKIAFSWGIGGSFSFEWD